MYAKKRWNRCVILAFLGATLLFLTSCSGKEQTSEVFSTKEEEKGEQKVGSGSQNENGGENSKEANKGMEQEQKEVYVYLCGEVRNPEVYKLSDSARVKDVINLAGGFTENAATEVVNLARPVVDGEQIYIPSKKEVKEGTISVPSVTSSKETDLDYTLVNINTASKEELMTLPGIGESKAESIISYRDTNGNFTSTEQIKEVEGIKEGVFSKIKDKITT